MAVLVPQVAAVVYSQMAFAAKLEEYGVTYVENYFPNSGHGLDVDAENVARAEQLFQEYVATYLDSE